ncbi:hypothetical protein R11007_04260 [Ralstonia holmesii]|uniref:Uncharacterized protein n=1 Tax=Ralstonia holmesii TaxID=3058602 RepID=A0ABC8QNU0_9RALS|nr:hypothetical protein R11007_04260 [Ralstonia sp. LMG 32967]CAJ0806963.1 hypothetical protein LMG18096_04882 [Ralstonia sp. LMG 32967]CAJ0821493.1 hypothetical protein LMG18093_04720 [Ralstonia sp. LMG 32967]
MPRLLLAAFVFYCAFASSQANALSQFSRACRFGDIPRALQEPAAVFFVLLGAPANTVNLPWRIEKESHWILESITTDYGAVRYYLFASSTLYRYRPGEGKYVVGETRYSRWAAQRPSDAVLKDSRLQIFLHNRGTLYSARAGHPAIYDVIEGPTARVGGTHWLYDPFIQETRPLAKTKATDCNLAEWGFETR